MKKGGIYSNLKRFDTNGTHSPIFQIELLWMLMNDAYSECTDSFDKRNRK